MNKLVEETLQSCQEYIPRLIEAHEQLATYFQGNEEAKGLDLFQLYIEGIDWLQQSVRGIQNLDHSKIPGIQVDEVNPKLIEIEEALQNRDYVLMGDLLDYEITPILEQWLKKVEEAL
ncbi:hypothetical protein [Effusibacillus lacus]|uniref:DUF8042 domain-containing protein n=1 Tax=Effusibacillus lacus TaxID=1348429 RepID=A0A292YK92_9BACL|nr:hypothetical protein [Effusibacillus lacus]TCS69824.1 hypothetical protein EDD64_13556 [Effusibacillus lacus]GAX88905.1 hypothetical protein EFBL_0519 [Effusibacillus lacus]